MSMHASDARCCTSVRTCLTDSTNSKQTCTPAEDIAETKGWIGEIEGIALPLSFFGTQAHRSGVSQRQNQLFWVLLASALPLSSSARQL